MTLPQSTSIPLVRRTLAVALLLTAVPAGAGESRIPARSDYRAIAAELTRVIEHERSDKQIPALSIALVDGNEIVWAEGFGIADPQKQTPATAATVYRV